MRARSPRAGVQRTRDANCHARRSRVRWPACRTTIQALAGPPPPAKCSDVRGASEHTDDVLIGSHCLGPRRRVPGGPHQRLHLRTHRRRPKRMGRESQRSSSVNPRSASSVDGANGFPSRLGSIPVCGYYRDRRQVAEAAGERSGEPNFRQLEPIESLVAATGWPSPGFTVSPRYAVTMTPGTAVAPSWSIRLRFQSEKRGCRYLLVCLDATSAIDAVQWDRPDNDPTSSNVGPVTSSGTRRSSCGDPIGARSWVVANRQ